VDKVAFTGSTAAGRQIAAACGERLKRVSLELGGKSAAIVLDDADIGTTMAGLKNASLMINGQACIAQTRILASRRRYDEIVGAVASLVGGLCIGDPLDEATEIGPLVSHRQQQTVEKYIALGQDEGARLVVGGNGMPDGESRGWFVRPTVFADVSNDMRVAREEIFGPVLCVIPYDNEAEAIDIANDSEFGLAGGVWTEDVDHGLDVARRIRTGVIGVNMFASDLAAPFGGYKDSGIGREYGREGLAEYLELKSMSIPLRTTGVDSATSG
jgi:betaine-aldehyde dehydrogenase